MKKIKHKLLMMKPIRVYIDTSVFGGCFDPEFQKASKLFFERIKLGHFIPCVSSIVAQEIERAPAEVRNAFKEIEGNAEMLEIDTMAFDLRDAYLNAGIVTEQWAPDASHVAMATVARCAMIVSWNFKHIVNFRRIPLYNAVNRIMGHGEIGIFSPQEVVEDEEEKV